MTSDESTKNDLQITRPTDDDAIEFGPNAVRLSVREWIIAASVLLLVVIFTPVVWKSIEPFEPQTDYRVPFDFSDDYWTYQRSVESTTANGKILVIGDSVVWGEYVDPQHTLSHYLNELHGAALFANGGLNGTHPLALQGLIESYAADINNMHVILHCNLLWMSSEERDLQAKKEMSFNHPRLVPQFVPSISCHKAPVDERIGIVIDHHIPFHKLVNHIRVAYYDSQDLHSWTLEHPYENPFEPIRLECPKPKNEPHSNPIPWTERAIPIQDIRWIDLDSSLQWQAFRATVELLRDRGNRVFVIVGPFNEHMLTEASRERYTSMRTHVETWLSNNAIPHHVTKPLPSHEYADASHPLGSGYARLAKQVDNEGEFKQWLADLSNPKDR